MLKMVTPVSFLREFIDRNQLLDKNGDFIRTEKKFLLNDIRRQHLIAHIRKKMPTDYPHKDTRFTLIESLYFDSDNLNLFQDHFNSQLPERFKVRIRNYGPNGKWQEGPVLLELKTKKAAKTKKTRFYITQKVSTRLQKGGLIDLDSILFQINPTVKPQQLIKRVDKINQLFTQYKLHPITRVRYRREAFEQDGLRVTIDSNLQIKEMGSCTYNWQDDRAIKERALKLSHKYNAQNRHILEVKFNGQFPAWLQRRLDRYATTSTSFSKYCYSVSTSSLICDTAAMSP